MKDAQKDKKSLQDSIKGLVYEEGNVRGLANQLTRVFLDHGVGKNPYELAWKVAKNVGANKGGNFGAKDVAKEMEALSKEVAQKPEYDEAYFKEQGLKGAKSLTHEERVKYGHMGATSLTNVGAAQ